MRARTINENNFERNQDPRDSLNIGRYRDNPMPQLNTIIKDYFNNPMDSDFADINRSFEAARDKIIRIILTDSFKTEFGDLIEDIEDSDRSIIYIRFKKNIIIKLHPSLSHASYSAEILQGNEYKYGDTGNARSAKSLIKKIKKLIKDKNIDL